MDCGVSDLRVYIAMLLFMAAGGGLVLLSQWFMRGLE